MTSDRRFERDIPELLAQLAPRVEPTPYRDDVVRLTARTRQRPAWTFPERWIPMDITLAPGRGRPRPIAALVAIALVGLLIGALLVAYVGSRPVAVPPPFGPAENGALYFSTADGDIMTMASLTAAPRAIVTGNSNDSGPLPSRDGRVIAFTRVVPGGTQVMVADADGTNVRPLDGVYAEFSEIDWAPTSDELAIISMIEGQRKLTVVPTDGTAATTLDTGMLDNSAFWYLPDGRILFKGTKIEDLDVHLRPLRRRSTRDDAADGGRCHVGFGRRHHRPVPIGRRHEGRLSPLGRRGQGSACPRHRDRSGPPGPDRRWPW